VLVHSQVIEHIRYEPRLFSEINRVLKIGGEPIIEATKRETV